MSNVESAPNRGSVVTVGTYDGVHLGHQHLIGCSLAAGLEADLPVYIVTFDRLPAEVVRPESTPKLLTGLEHKLALLEATGADEVVVLHFDAVRAKESAEDFIAEYLVGELQARAIYVGTSFRFGAGARGDIALLEELALPFGYSAHGIELVTDDETKTVVSSTRIRALVADGELAEAGRLLGRPHELRGGLLADPSAVVVHGSFAMPPAGRYDVVVGLPGGESVGAVAMLLDSGALAAEVLITLDADDAPFAKLRSGTAIAVRFG